MAKVLKKFRDKLDNYRIYDVGEDFNGERQEYLASLGFIEAADVLDGMTKAELLEYAKTNEIEGVNQAMNKAEIIEAIKAVK